MKVWFAGFRLVGIDKSTGPMLNPKIHWDTLQFASNYSGAVFMLTDTLGSLVVSLPLGLAKLRELSRQLRSNYECMVNTDDNILTKLDPEEPLEFINFDLRREGGAIRIIPKFDYKINGKSVPDLVARFNAKALGLKIGACLKQDEFGITVEKIHNDSDDDIPAKICEAPYINKLGEELLASGNTTKFKCGSNLLSLGDLCFSKSLLSEIEFNESLLSIGFGTFRDCRLLGELVLPNSLRFLGDSSIVFCNNLRYLELNKGLRFVGRGAVSQCKNLSEIKINVTDHCAFADGCFYHNDIRKVHLAKSLNDNEQIEVILSKIKNDSSGKVDIVLF